jgi:hypothetical protein
MLCPSIVGLLFLKRKYCLPYVLRTIGVIVISLINNIYIFGIEPFWYFVTTISNIMFYDKPI